MCRIRDLFYQYHPIVRRSVAVSLRCFRCTGFLLGIGLSCSSCIWFKTVPVSGNPYGKSSEWFQKGFQVKDSMYHSHGVIQQKWTFSNFNGHSSSFFFFETWGHGICSKKLCASFSAACTKVIQTKIPLERLWVACKQQGTPRMLPICRMWDMGHKNLHWHFCEFLYLDDSKLLWRKARSDHVAKVILWSCFWKVFGKELISSAGYWLLLLLAKEMLSQVRVYETSYQTGELQLNRCGIYSICNEPNTSISVCILYIQYLSQYLCVCACAPLHTCQFLDPTI